MQAWLQCRTVALLFANRYKHRLQMYFTVLLVMVVGDIIWQVAIHVRTLAASSGAAGRGLHGLGSAEAVMLAVPAAVALALMLAAGAFINAQHSEQESVLLHHRLLLREWAPEVEPPPPAAGAPGYAPHHPQRRAWAVDASVDDMLRITAKVVAASERVRVLGLEATDSLLKGYLSLLGSAALVITGLQNLLQGE